MTNLNVDQMVAIQGGNTVAAKCKLLERSNFMSMRYSYWACSNGTYYATISKFSATKQEWEVLTDLEFPESW